MRNDEFRAGTPEEGLSDHEKSIIDFAGKTYRYPGKQEQDILDQFGYRATTFFRRLNTLLDNPHAEAYAPTTIHRYRRIVDDGLTKNGRQPRYSDPGENQ